MHQAQPRADGLPLSLDGAWSVAGLALFFIIFIARDSVSWMLHFISNFSCLYLKAFPFPVELLEIVSLGSPLFRFVGPTLTIFGSLEGFFLLGHLGVLRGHDLIHLVGILRRRCICSLLSLDGGSNNIFFSASERAAWFAENWEFSIFSRTGIVASTSLARK